LYPSIPLIATSEGAKNEYELSCRLVFFACASAKLF
jgi:hypothetical protein